MHSYFFLHFFQFTKQTKKTMQSYEVRYHEYIVVVVVVESLSIGTIACQPICETINCICQGNDHSVHTQTTLQWSPHKLILFTVFANTFFFSLFSFAEFTICDKSRLLGWPFVMKSITYLYTYCTNESK